MKEKNCLIFISKIHRLKIFEAKKTIAKQLELFSKSSYFQF
jgi:hypothetical protein